MRTARTNIASYLAHTLHHCSNTNDITVSHTLRTFVFTDAGTALYLQMLVAYLSWQMLVAHCYLRMLLSHCKCLRTCIFAGACMGRYLYLFIVFSLRMLVFALPMFAFRSACICVQHPTVPVGVAGPDGASSLYALPLLLPCMPFVSIASGLYVVPSSRTPTHPHTHKRHTTVCPALASCLYALHLHLVCMSCHPPAQKKSPTNHTKVTKEPQRQPGRGHFGRPHSPATQTPRC